MLDFRLLVETDGNARISFIVNKLVPIEMLKLWLL